MYETLYHFLQSLGFRQTKSDHGVFVSKDIFIAVYTNDILILGQNISQLKKLQSVLKAHFCMTDLGEVSHYLSRTIDIKTNKAEITLKQMAYLEKILQRFNIQNYRLIPILMEPGVGTLLFPSEEQADKETIIWY